TFETKDKLFDQLREDYGVFWKLEDPESYQTTYIRYNTGLFGSSYDHVAHENLIYVANSLEFGAPNRATPLTSDRASWGKRIAACVLGGLLISAGRSWGSNQNSVSDAIATMKGTLGPTAFKATVVFQMSAIAAVSRHGGGALPGALLAGIMLLPEPVQGQSLCPQLVGSYTPADAAGVAVSGSYAYVADWTSGLQIIDISNVANLTLAGSYDTPGNAYDIALSGNYAYVADYTAGLLQIIDISNVANPTLAGSYDTPSEAFGVVLSGNYAFVTDWGSGLQIISISCPNPTSSSSTTRSSTSSSTTRSSTSSLAPTLQSTTAIFSLSTDSTTTTTPVFISTTGSISSSTSTNPASLVTNNPTLFSTTNAPSSTSFVTEPSTIKFTTRYATRPTVSNGPRLLWLGLLGGGLCICLIGGTVFILRRRQKASRQQASLPELGSNSETHNVVELKPMEGEMGSADGVTHERGYGKTSDFMLNDGGYQKTPDFVTYEDAYQKTPNFVTNKPDTRGRNL
ncbi:MAG: hypothetical protein K940chlam7_01689, partial [Chlamydiae bacterium]|nr:hypothetical protein [Chlamydiota bacterium]